MKVGSVFSWDGMELAWVPAVERGAGRDEEARRDALAARWVNERCSGGNGLLVTVDKKLTDSAAKRFGDKNTHWSHKGPQDRRGSGGATWCWRGVAKELDRARSLAEGGPLCATEWPSFRLTGLAAYVGALDLVTGEVTSALDGETRELLDFAAAQGHNAYSRQLDRDLATSAMENLRGRIDRVQLLGALLAAGLSDNALNNLENRVLSNVWPRPSERF